MIKKLLITGFALVFISACGTDPEEENADQAAEPKNNVEENIANDINTGNQSNDHDESGTDSSSDTSNTGDIAHPDVSLTEAVNIFNEAYPGVDIQSIDFETKGRLHYDIDGFDSTKEYDVEIDATTKEIREKEVETDRDRDEESLDFSVIIDPAEAMEIASAEKEVEGLSPTGWSLEADDGIQKYTIEYDDNKVDIEIEINAETGDILDVDIDN